jgi:hypothetical protein
MYQEILISKIPGLFKDSPELILHTRINFGHARSGSGRGRNLTRDGGVRGEVEKDVGRSRFLVYFISQVRAGATPYDPDVSR